MYWQDQTARKILRNGMWLLAGGLTVAAAVGCDRASSRPESPTLGDNVGWAGYNNGYGGQTFAALDGQAFSPSHSALGMSGQIVVQW